MSVDDELGGPPPRLPEPVAEPIVGYRVWTVRRADTVTLTRQMVEACAAAHEAGDNPWPSLAPEGARLWPLVTQHGAWGRVEDAFCHRSDFSAASATMTVSGVQYGNYPGASVPHAAPAPGCHCGVWALRTPEAARDKARGMVCVAVGSVELWGRVLEHEDGWRAQHARPVDITLIHAGDDAQAWADELAAFYGCNVTVERPGPQPEFDPATLTLQPSAYSAALIAQNRLLAQQSAAVAMVNYKNALAARSRRQPPRAAAIQWTTSDRLPLAIRRRRRHFRNACIGAAAGGALSAIAQALGWL